MVSFNTSKLSLVSVFQHLKAGYINRHKVLKSIICETTITDGNAKFSVPGACINLPCVTKGVAKFTLPLIYFESLITSYKEPDLFFTLSGEYVCLKNISVKADVCYIQDDTILKSINLPLNYTALDLINLQYAGYTPEEFKFNRIQKQIDAANERITKEIQAIFSIKNGKLFCTITGQYSLPLF